MSAAPPSENWSELAGLVDALLDTPPERREARIEELSAGDPGRRAVLERLLAECEREPVLLSLPAAERFAALFDDDVAGFPETLAERYRLTRELGRGGMATVYLARDLKHGRDVAVKVLHPVLASALGPERFLREIEIAAKLSHPHILGLHDSGEAGGVLYYVMPYVAGESLRDRLQRERQLPVDEALHLTREVASALSYAHGEGVVHRDIKPENILLQAGHAVVADFGIARALSVVGAQAITETGVAVGTPTYMSPEQADGASELDGRSDVYSLGCVLYEMLAGHPPYAGATAREILARHALDPVPSLRAARPDVSEALERIVGKALAKVPVARFATADEFAQAVTAAPLAARRPRRRAAALGAAALVVGGIGVTGYLLRGRAPSSGVSDNTGGVRPEPAIVVLPFRVVGQDLEFWREGIVDMLSFNLEGIGGLRKIDPATVMTAWTRTVGAERDVVPGAALDVARGVGARYTVTGSAVELRGAVRLTAEVYDVERAAVRGSAQVDGPADSVLGLVDRLTVELVRKGLVPSEGGLPAMNLSRVTTTSVPALKAYLAGERHYRRGRFPEAVGEFRRAVELDSTFARAAYRLAASYDWTAEFELEHQYAAQAARFADRLPERDALLVRSAGFRSPRRIALLERLTSRYPDDADAWNALADNYFHAGGVALLPASAFREAFEKAVDLFPHYVDSYVHLIEDAFVRLDSAGVRALIAASRAVDPAHPPCPGYALVYELTWGTAARQARAAAALDTVTVATSADANAQSASSESFTCAWTAIAAAPAAVERGERVDLVELRSRTHGRPAPALWRMLQARLMNGQLAAVRRLLAAGVEAPPSAILAHRFAVQFHLLGFTDSAGVRAATRAIQRSGEPDDYFWLGALAVAEARWADVEPASRAIESRARALAAAGDSAKGGYAVATAAALRAYAGVRRGEWDQLPRFEAALRRVEPEGFFPVPGKFLSYQVGRLLLDHGRMEDAERYFQSRYQYDWEYYVPAQYYLGQILEARGQRAEAAMHYDRFVTWWRDSDPELRDWLREGHEARRRLTREPRRVDPPR